MAVGKEISKSPLDDLEAKWLGYEWLANSKMFNPENVQKQYREQNEVAGKTPEELLTNCMNDRQNKSHTTYTCPVTNNSNITLGGNKGVANDRRDVATYSDRIAKMKIRTCSCGDKLRGKQEICNDCINETFLNNL